MCVVLIQCVCVLFFVVVFWGGGAACALGIAPCTHHTQTHAPLKKQVNAKLGGVNVKHPYLHLPSES